MRYIEHEGQKLNCILLSLQLMPHVQGMEVDQDGVNLANAGQSLSFVKL